MIKKLIDKKETKYNLWYWKSHLITRDGILAIINNVNSNNELEKKLFGNGNLFENQ